MNENRNSRNPQQYADFDDLARIVVRRALEQQQVAPAGKNQPVGASPAGAAGTPEGLISTVVSRLRDAMRRKHLGLADTAVREAVRRLDTVALPRHTAR